MQQKRGEKNRGRPNTTHTVEGSKWSLSFVRQCTFLKRKYSRQGRCVEQPHRYSFITSSHMISINIVVVAAISMLSCPEPLLGNAVAAVAIRPIE